jgi:DNA-binding transcriptional ArsR family regulator
MRAYEIFAAMPPEQAVEIMRALGEHSPATVHQAIALASAALKSRPVYLQRQPFEKRAAAVRRALGRVASNSVAEEILATYFLECRRPLLTEWLDAVGLEHDEGTLREDEPAQPAKKKLREAVKTFRNGDDAADRELLLRAFAAQPAIRWPELDTLLAPGK